MIQIEFNVLSRHEAHNNLLFTVVSDIFTPSIIFKQIFRTEAERDQSANHFPLQYVKDANQWMSNRRSGWEFMAHIGLRCDQSNTRCCAIIYSETVAVVFGYSSTAGLTQFNENFENFKGFCNQFHNEFLEIQTLITFQLKFRPLTHSLSRQSQKSL